MTDEEKHFLIVCPVDAGDIGTTGPSDRGC